MTSFPVTHVGLVGRRRARGVRPRERDVRRGAERKAPLCRVGRSMNLRKQVEPLKKPRFRLPRTEACTPRGVATHLGETLAQTSLPPSRAKQGTQTLDAILVGSRSGFKVQGAGFGASAGRRNATMPSGRDRAVRSSSPARSASSPSARACRVAAAEQLVGDVERGEHRQAQRVAGRRRVGGGAHLLVDVGAPAARRTPDRARCGSGTAARGSRPG